MKTYCSRRSFVHRAVLLLALVVWQIHAVRAGAPARPEPLVAWSTEHALFQIDTAGSITAITQLRTGRNYLARGEPAPVLSIRSEGRWQTPESATWDATGQRLHLRFTGSPAQAVLAVTAKPTHIVLSVVEVVSQISVEVALWGPYPTTIRATIGETVGVVRDGDFAIGLQSLNPKTMGGYPSQESDIESGRETDDHGVYADLPPELNKDQSYRGDTAWERSFGSELRAYTRNRERSRVMSNWGHERFFAPAFPDGGVQGSSIALFGCPASKALETIGRIEELEGLPHPILGGVWAKISPESTASYLIVDFGEGTMQRAIEMAQRAGLKYVYHSSPFATWGHFQLKPNAFPNGWSSLRACRDQAERAGIHIGVHTLSNFITPNDPYVTPKPDARLAQAGSSTLSATVDATQTNIPVADLELFLKKSALNTARIGDELIRYASVSNEGEKRLLGCERGAWGTQAASHDRGQPVAKLLDHDYGVFLTDGDLAQEIARNLAALFNDTGALQISFDGLEGNWSTGLGQYGRTLFVKAWYDALAPELHGKVINDASNPGHFNWHINTRMNWGEPWYAGFRESQTLYRFKNQVYFERNLMPRMLGWFALRPETTLEDIEWMLARAAGYHAGFGLATSLASTAQLAADPSSADTLQRFGATPAILQAIHHWETARLAGAFSPSIRAALRDNTREFHLSAIGQHAWNLFEVTTRHFTYESGNSERTEYAFENPNVQQTLQWIIRCESTNSISSIHLEVDGTPALTLESQALAPKTVLRYTGGPEALLCDVAGKELRRLAVQPSALEVNCGPHRLSLTAGSAPGVKVKVELRTLSAPTRIESAHPNG